MAAHVREAGISPQVVICSTATRARQTLAGVQHGLSPSPEVRFDDDAYTFEWRALLGLVRGLDDAVDAVMLVGHNPAMQDLAVTLAGGGDDLAAVKAKVPTGALIALDFEVHSWGVVEVGCATVASFTKPRSLEARR